MVKGAPSLSKQIWTCGHIHDPGKTPSPRDRGRAAAGIVGMWASWEIESTRRTPDKNCRGRYN